MTQENMSIARGVFFAAFGEATRCEKPTEADFLFVFEDTLRIIATLSGQNLCGGELNRHIARFIKRYIRSLHYRWVRGPLDMKAECVRALQEIEGAVVSKALALAK